MSQRGFQFGRRLLANMIQKSRERNKRFWFFFLLLQYYFSRPESVVYNQLNHTALVHLYIIPAFVKVPTKTCKLVYQLVIKLSANHIQFNIKGGIIRLHLAIFIKVGVIWCVEDILLLFF